MSTRCVAIQRKVLKSQENFMSGFIIKINTVSRDLI